ncbi:hypothetical protein FisN_22Hh089 [Fistulifera solaris]|jgi:pimeloyl-ACP methyl ester carboxylesterase|uniref:Alpha/beta hydrolase fold-5 domain-containing protein n=1 Tax=Fistulifera solaris TaxID=1519565 RepID=A0A1Z5K7S8_FISSO|nr:hypothetical protein FisN_22Hh089 [Fistulifera solaris]|eukprot:GAX22297.1 hypothetical protein FisN_22Hh089 [Fistulifera solaris]
MTDRTEEGKRILQYRRIAQRPWGAQWWEDVQLLSPFTWRGAARIGKVQWEWKKLFQSALALLMPLVFGKKIRMSEIVPRHSVIGLSAIWSMAWLWRGTTGLRAVWHKTFTFSRWSQMLGFPSVRSPAQEDAWRVLSERIMQQRAYRTRKYDVYLPLPTGRAMEAILFLPGFGVEHVAYAESAARLADAGFVVVVVSAEPLRVASKELGFASSRIRDIPYQVCRELNVPLSWSVMGHSLGSFTATHVSLELDIPRVVLWGSAPMDDLIADLSNSNKRVLILQGSEDKIIEFMVPDEHVRQQQTENFYRKLPKNTITKMIEGGNHKGFGSYTPAFSIEKSSGIPRSEQQSQAVAFTVDFLQNV